MCAASRVEGKREGPGKQEEKEGEWCTGKLHTNTDQKRKKTPEQLPTETLKKKKQPLRVNTTDESNSLACDGSYKRLIGTPCVKQEIKTRWTDESSPLVTQSMETDVNPSSKYAQPVSCPFRFQRHCSCGAPGKEKHARFVTHLLLSPWLFAFFFPPSFACFLNLLYNY